MAKTKFSKMIKVPLREGWPLERRDFSGWMASNDGLEYLSREIGLNLSLIQQEATVGRFSADLLCKGTCVDKTIVIENQLSRSDHSHFGQLLTYAYNTESEIAIWIAEDFSEEHLSAVISHNQSKTFPYIFAIEIALYKVEDAILVPRFNVKAQPSNWKSIIKNWRSEASDLEKLQLEYWTAFQIFCSKHPQERCPTPQSKHYLNYSLGIPGVSLSIKILASNSTICVELHLDPKSDQYIYDFLLGNRAFIERELGITLDWYCGGKGNSKQIGDIFKCCVWNP